MREELGWIYTESYGRENLLCAYLAMPMFAGVAANTLFGGWTAS